MKQDQESKQGADNQESAARKFGLVKVSGIVTGVGVVEKTKEGDYSEEICQTFYDTGNPEADAKTSEKNAKLILAALESREAPPLTALKEKIKKDLGVSDNNTM